MTNKLMASTYIEQLIRHEAAVASIYRLFESHLPGDAEFWSLLAAQEEWHADILRGLKQEVLDGQLDLRPEHLILKNIEISLEYINNTKRIFSSKSPAAVQALEIAQTIEDNTLDSEGFAVFDGDAPNAREAFDTITAQTVAHRNLPAKRREASQALNPSAWVEKLRAIAGIGKKAH
ncbi:MAG: hypothetical protein HY770_01615 [Chitinivibrionia bacterium]|nr:hypothetical protein [Chitinivibrionia bacterium]